MPTIEIREEDRQKLDGLRPEGADLADVVENVLAWVDPADLPELRDRLAECPDCGAVNSRGLVPACWQCDGELPDPRVA